MLWGLARARRWQRALSASATKTLCARSAAVKASKGAGRAPVSPAESCGGVGGRWFGGGGGGGGIESCTHRRPFWAWLKRDGTCLDGVCSIYQGHRFFQKATYGCRHLEQEGGVVWHGWMCFEARCLFQVGEIGIPTKAAILGWLKRLINAGVYCLRLGCSRKFRIVLLDAFAVLVKQALVSSCATHKHTHWCFLQST